MLPAYLIGMALAGTVGRDHALIRRLRTITIGLLTPFYFIRAGYFVSIPAVVAAPLGVIALIIVEMSTKVVSVYPIAKWFGSPHKDAMYTTLLMASGLTFGTISALFGLSHKIIDESQYSTLVAAIIGTAIIPTVIANSLYLPRHLLPEPESRERADRLRSRSRLSSWTEAQKLNCLAAPARAAGLAGGSAGRSAGPGRSAI